MNASPVILYVHDVVAAASTRSGVLTQAGYRVLDASLGEEALLMAAALRPRLVVLDADLRGSAWALGKRIKSDPYNSHIMVLLLSSATHGAVEVDPDRHGGVDGYLVEPIEPLEFLTTVRALLRLSDREVETRRLLERSSRLERQFAEATDAADCGMWDWDIRSGKLEWIGQAERLAGLRPGGFNGKIEGFYDVLHPEDRHRLVNRVNELTGRKAILFEDEHRYVHPDGSVHWMSAIGRFFYDAQGQAIRMTGVVKEITRRKLAEQRQELESERRRLLARAAEALLVDHQPAEMMTEIFETVRRHLDLDGYFYYRVDEPAPALVLGACAGVREAFRAGLERVSFGQGLCGTAAQRRGPEIWERLQDSHDEKAQGVKALGFHAFACHPLMVGDHLLGTLAFASATRDKFEPDEIVFMQSICRYVAAAMERLRLEAVTRERAEQLRQSEEHLRIAMELNPQIPWTARPDGSLEGMSDRWFHFSGCAREAALDDSWMRVQHEDDLPRMIAAWSHSIQTGDPYDVEHRVKPLSGGHRWMRSRAFPRRDEGGRIVRWYGTTEDIHDRKLAEAALLEWRERLEGALQFCEAVMANIKEGLYTLDASGLVTYVNPAAETLLGWSAGELLGKRMHEIIHYQHRDGSPFPAKTCAGLQVLCEGKTLVEHPDVFIRKDGTFFDVVYSSAPMWSEDRISGLVLVFRDVSEKQQTERALLESEERFRTMAQAVPSFLFETDGKGWNTWTSEGWCRFTGQTQEQVRGHGWAEALHPDDRAANLGRWTECMREGVPFEARQRLRRHDGYYAWVIAKALPVRNEQGTITRWLGSVTDVDDMVRGEEALRESEERFRQIAETTDYVFWVMQLDPERIIYASPACERLWQQPAHAFYKDPRLWADAIHPDERAMVQQAFEQWLEHPEHKTFDVEYRIVRPDGTLRWIADRGHVIRDAHGQVYRMTGIARDVTDVKIAEKALRRSETQLRVITDAVPSFIAYVDSDERYRFVNAEYEKWFDRPRQEIVGLSVQELLGDGYWNSEPFIRRVLAGEAVTFERTIHYGGAQRTVQTSYTPDVRDDGTVAGFYVLVTDISDRKRHEDDLRRWKDELEMRVEERTRELMTSQERLRALASQLSLTEQRERRKLASDLHDYLAQILVVGRMKVSRLAKAPSIPYAMLEKLEDIDIVFQQGLHYARTLIAELSPPSLHESGFPTALRWLRERMQKEGLWVEVHVNREEFALSEDRAVFLFQSVRELLFNVLKHAGVDRATVTVTAADDGGVCVAVADCGKGLGADAMERAAKPGHLGLFAVCERMEAMGGKVDVASMPGVGTTVTIMLPGAA